MKDPFFGYDRFRSMEEAYMMLSHLDMSDEKLHELGLKPPPNIIGPQFDGVQRDPCTAIDKKCFDNRTKKRRNKNKRARKARKRNRR